MRGLVADARRSAGRLLAAIVLVCLVLAAPARADTLVVNVNGITLDERGAVQRFAALLFGDDGKVKALYQGKDKRPKAQYQVDGRGRTLLPGLIDSHVSLSALGFAALTLDLSDTRSLAEAQATIARYAAEHPDRPWLLGRGWDQARWGLGRYPTAAELDAAVAGRPVWLVSGDGHAGWSNGAALAAAGIGAATPQPAGGRIERLPGGAPAGVMVEQAMALVERVVPPPRAVDRDLALDRAQQALAARGVTAVADMGTTLEDWQAYRRAGDLGRLRLRIMAYAQGSEAMVLLAGSEPTPWLYDDKLRLNGVRLALDGALSTHGAWLKAAYADKPGERGLSRLTRTQLANLMSRAAMDGFQVAVEAGGDQAAATLLEVIEELAETYRGDRRWRLERAEAIDPADLPRLGRLGIVASLQPPALAGRATAEARLGPSRLPGAYAWKSLAAAGATLAFGSAAPAAVPDPFAGLAAALTREDGSGEPFGGWQPQERIGRVEALAAYTTGAARAGFAERRFGRLAPGLRADFVLIDSDPLLASPAELRRTRISETWVGGQKVFTAAAQSSPTQVGAQAPPLGR